MPAPLYLALIRRHDNSIDVRTYTSLATMQRDESGKRIVVSWCKRNSLRQAIATGRDWPVDVPSEQRDDILAQLDQLTALHESK